ncbi:GNAT family N-acetyltransferase [Kribbella ginsengisoli]|uniref:N-acetyltransferase domain-containing protein n=1 Tax=Kribbella ginsengisoli TaxID=363865 RepID=A0ABP6VNJ2_9ACTN
MSLDRITQLLETAEAEAIWGYETHAAPEVMERFGMASARIGGGVALAVRDDATNYWSRALGFGFTEPVTAEVVASVTDFYRGNGNSIAVLNVAPSVLPADWDAICAKEGITGGGTWVKLARPAGLVNAPETELRVAEIEPADAELWATVLTRGFGMPEELLVPMSKGVVGQPGWTAYGAYEGDQLIAAAALLITSEVAEFCGAATLPEHRGKGAQSALLAARAARAVAEGVKWFSAETGKPDEGSKNSSLNNMMRAGFEVRYDRRNWIWRP